MYSRPYISHYLDNHFSYTGFIPFGVAALTDELEGDFVPELLTVCGVIGGRCSCSGSESLCGFSRFTEERLLVLLHEDFLSGSCCSGLACFSTGLCCSSSLSGLVACGPTAVLSPSVFS